MYQNINVVRRLDKYTTDIPRAGVAGQAEEATGVDISGR